MSGVERLRRGAAAVYHRVRQNKALRVVLLVAVVGVFVLILSGSSQPTVSHKSVPVTTHCQSQASSRHQSLQLTPGHSQAQGLH